MFPTPVRAAAPALALLLGACGDDGTTLGSASIDEELPPTTVPGTAGADLGGALPTLLPPIDLDVTQSDEYASEDYGSIVTGITIRALSLSVAPGSEDDDLDDGMLDDLSFLSEIDLSISATLADGTEAVARIGGIPENDPRLDPAEAARTVALDMTGVDILEFVEAPDGYRVLIGVGGFAPPDDVTFDGDVTYRIGLGLR